MEPSSVAARFVAFVCFLNSGQDGKRSPHEAGRLARENWRPFLPYASDELVKALERRPRLSAGKVRRRKMAAAC